MSLGLDLKIMWWTVMAVFKRSGPKSSSGGRIIMKTLSTRLVRALATSLLLLVLGGTAVASPHRATSATDGHSGASGSPSDRSPREGLVQRRSGGPANGPTAGGLYIHRLDTSTETFVSTGVLVDTRSSSRQDTLGRLPSCTSLAEFQPRRGR
jgi:hypothetical protein